MNQYETLFIVTPNLDESEMIEVTNGVKDLIESNGGEMLFLDPWGRKKLAYPVNRHSDGYYVLIVFAIEDTEILQRLNTHFRITESVIRHLVVKFEGDLEKMNQRSKTAIKLESDPTSDDETEE